MSVQKFMKKSKTSKQEILSMPSHVIFLLSTLHSYNGKIVSPIYSWQLDTKF